MVDCFPYKTGGKRCFYGTGVSVGVAVGRIRITSVGMGVGPAVGVSVMVGRGVGPAGGVKSGAPGVAVTAEGVPSLGVEVAVGG